MMKLFFLTLLLISPLSQSATHYFVRHAEKDLSNPTNRNPELSLKGQQRAKNLALLLSQAGIKRIYSTAYIRTEMTAKPLADLLGITVTHYDPRALETLIEQLKKENENSLIVGHSNTTTEAVSILTNQSMNGLSEKDYGDVFQVLSEGDKTTLTHLKLPPIGNKKTPVQDIKTK